MSSEPNTRPLVTKAISLLCVGYVVLFNSYLALACGAMSWESFRPTYRLPQIALGLKAAAFALLFATTALGVALGHRWARWLSIAFGSSALCFSVFLFWDGFLRIKPKYSGEESSEVFGALVFSLMSLVLLAAMFAPVAKSYFKDADDTAPLQPTSPRGK